MSILSHLSLLHRRQVSGNIDLIHSCLVATTKTAVTKRTAWEIIIKLLPSAALVLNGKQTIGIVNIAKNNAACIRKLQQFRSISQHDFVDVLSCLLILTILPSKQTISHKRPSSIKPRIAEDRIWFILIFEFESMPAAMKRVKDAFREKILIWEKKKRCL